MKKKQKYSDSDYKAEDQGSSANDIPSKKRALPKKNIYTNPKLNKKQIFEVMAKSFIPQGIELKELDKISQQKYDALKTIKDADEFSLNFKQFLGKIVKVTDGDTIKAVIFLNEKPTKFTFRIDGVDTPQTRKGQVREFGSMVKKIITQMLDQKLVRIQAGNFDKYGRVLARIYFISQGKEVCLNEFLIQNDMGKSYHGKTKTQFTGHDYQEFIEKYGDTVWPTVQDYPYKKIPNKVMSFYAP